MLALAAIVVIVALVVIPGGDESGETERAAGTITEQTPASDPEAAPEQPAPKPKPKPPLLQAGEERELAFRKGETVTFRVRHSEDEDVHVHGYDKKKNIKAGRTATMSFEATIEGIFEIELERSGVSLGTLKVEPK